jgi:hypothetical protein
VGGYIDGKVPLQGTTLAASVCVQTPYIQQGDGASVLGVPNPAGADGFVVLSGVQTLSSKTFLGPTIVGGTVSGAVFTTGEVLESEVYSNSMYHNISFDPVVVTVADGATKTLNFFDGDVFRVNLTQACTLTISATSTSVSKAYMVIVKQAVANEYFPMSWMTGFVNGMVASGPTQKTGAIDYWQILYDWDTAKHYAIGVKDVQS